MSKCTATMNTSINTAVRFTFTGLQLVRGYAATSNRLRPIVTATQNAKWDEIEVKDISGINYYIFHFIFAAAECTVTEWT